MLLGFIDRQDLVKLLPQGACMAEVGTLKGDFAETILKNANPTELHLIDPWDYQPDSEYAVNHPEYDHKNVEIDAEEMNRRYTEVQARFAPSIAAGKVKLYRAYSPQAAELFPDDFFDIVYIDATHTKSAVLADLRAFDRKVKKDGLILGHDYTAHATYRAMNFGVVEAVNQFVEETGYEFMFLTSDRCATYVLAKSQQSRMRGALLNNILIHVKNLIEIGSPHKRAMTERDVINEQGEYFRTIVGFH